ncbi:hypothetical protein [Rudaeicoccus suwonensis]|uniref:Mobilization protein MobC n=1 Tax=Rudaeicoccus suwonensis TaxID=657409 RepID=A0A561DVK2_9MICO|nr:hypothetical protein [Rudaeicoccus suwonensis]TWE07382.1 hypothetical protein BKA23_3395 [Rudaeicoccus suwonensis]
MAAEETPESGGRDGIFRRRRTDGRREHRTVIKHTAAEWARVQSMAHVAGISVPRLYERALFAGGVVQAQELASIQLEMEAALRMIGLAGSNLNQAAKVANATGEVHWPQIQAAADVVTDRLMQLVSIMGRLPDGSFGEAFPGDEQDADRVFE